MIRISKPVVPALVCAAIVLVAVPVRSWAAEATPEGEPSPYEVVWDSPSEDCNGTMPLGNGEVALNAWIEPSGDLRFYIARTDSWDDNGRLLKVGSLRIRVGDGSTERTKTFRQALTVKDGTLTARYGEGDGQVDLRLWVDANRPVVCVEIDTRPADRGRGLRRTVADQPGGRCRASSAATCSTAAPRRRWSSRTRCSPDLADRIGLVSPQHQVGRAGAVREDPGHGRLPPARSAAAPHVRGPGGHRSRRSGSTTGRSAPSRARGTCSRSTCTRKHPATAEQWLAETQRGSGRGPCRRRLAERRAAHERWWAEFWDRSWIHITVERPAGRQRRERRCPAGQQAARAAGHGSGRRLAVCRHVRPRGHLRGAAGRRRDRRTGGPRAAGKGRRPSGAASTAQVPEGPAVAAGTGRPHVCQGLTIEAWIKPDAERARGAMRIVDKITPGGADGFLFDTYPGNSLRVIVGQQTVQQGERARGRPVAARGRHGAARRTRQDVPQRQAAVGRRQRRHEP